MVITKIEWIGDDYDNNAADYDNDGNRGDGDDEIYMMAEVHDHVMMALESVWMKKGA